jgi:predicted enzyme related to lactoylglutathione lyase
MKLTFLFTPVTDLDTALAFYRDTLGWSEAWREGETTVAFQLPDSDVQFMIDNTPMPAGPMYEVDSVEKFLAGKPDLDVRVPQQEMPGGFMAGFADPSGNVVYVFDQSTAEPAE